MNNRIKILEKLVHFDEPLIETLKLLQPFGWDSTKIFIVLSRNDVVSVLKRYIQSDLSSSDIEEWANAIEGREDIGYEADYENILHSTIHELANPLLTHPFTLQRAKEMIGKLS